MKKKYILILLCVLLLSLTGCRVRTVSGSEDADTIIELPGDAEPQPQVEEPPSEEPEKQESSEEEPEQPSEPDTPTEDSSVEETRPDAAGTISSSGAEQLAQQVTEGVTVTYDPNGGDTEAVSITVEVGGTYGPQPDAVRRGCAFLGWYTEKSGGELVTGDTVVNIPVSHTLYAHWQAKPTSTVTFDPNGGRIKSAQARMELSEGDRFGQLPTPIREGYELDGWYTLAEGGEQITADSVFSAEGDVTLYAHWTYDPYQFWSFTLKNTTQQIYLCQQVSIYYEQEADHVTEPDCPLISATGSFNIAENRDDPNVSDDWVLAKKPAVVVKCVSSLDSASSVCRDMASRFPEQQIILIARSAISGDESTILFGRLSLAKLLYADWYADVDLSVAARELGVAGSVIYCS